MDKMNTNVYNELIDANDVWYVYRKKKDDLTLTYCGLSFGLYSAMNIIKWFIVSDNYDIKRNEECNKITLNSKDWIFYIQMEAEYKENNITL